MASSTDIGELRKLRVVDLREKLSKLRLPTGGEYFFKFWQSTVNLPTGSFSFEVFFRADFTFLRHVVIDQCHIDA